MSVEVRPQAQGQEENLQQLVESLASLHDMERTTLRLMACGRAAVPALRAFLFRVDPSGTYEPRCWAARALGRIGAHEVLVEFLNREHSCSDPVAQLGEEAVVHTAARSLAAVTSEEAYQSLLRVARWRSLAGPIEVLGEYRRPEVIPVLIRALEDDAARSSAEGALSNFGESVGPALFQASIRKEPTPDHESPSSVLRRRSALRLLTETRTAAHFWRELRELMHDRDFLVQARACRIGLDCGNEAEKANAGLRLVRLLSVANGYVRSEIEDALIHHFEAVREIVEEHLKQEDTVASRRSLTRVVRLATSATDH